MVTAWLFHGLCPATVFCPLPLVFYLVFLIIVFTVWFSAKVFFFFLHETEHFCCLGKIGNQSVSYFMVFYIYIITSEMPKLCCLLFYLFFKINLFIYFWLCWVFVAVRGLPLVVASGGYSSLQCAGFSLRWLLLVRSMGSRRVGFSSCGMRAQ